jgi:hypothetical protein
MKGNGMEFTMVAISLQRLLEMHKFVIEQPDRQTDKITRCTDQMHENTKTDWLSSFCGVYSSVQVVISLLL